MSQREKNNTFEEFLVLESNKLCLKMLYKFMIVSWSKNLSVETSDHTLCLPGTDYLFKR